MPPLFQIACPGSSGQSLKLSRLPTFFRLFGDLEPASLSVGVKRTDFNAALRPVCNLAYNVRRFKANRRAGSIGEIV